MEDKRAEIRAKIHEKLTATGEREKLKEFIQKRLEESGWKDKVKVACKDYIRNKGVDNVTVDEVVAAVTPIARSMVPEEVKRDVLERMRQFLMENDFDI